VNLILCAKEVVRKYEGRLTHSNDIVSVSAMDIKLVTKSRYFSQEQDVAIGTFLI